VKRLPFRLLKVGHCRHPECIAVRGGSWRFTEFPALVGLIEHPDIGPVLYDTGYSPHFEQATQHLPERLYRWVTPHCLPEREQLGAQLEKLGIAPADVRLVLVSHFHADHVAGAKDFPNARFVAMRADWDAVTAMGRIEGLRHAFLPSLLPADFAGRLSFAEDAARIELPGYCRPFADGHDLLGDGSLIAVPLPGHTECQMGLFFQDASGRPFFLVADACWSLESCRDNRPPTRIASLIVADGARFLDTFGRIRTLLLREPEVAVLPSHCAQSWRTHGHAPA
jgi:glyoxylase-like metal-dependent hydrolase (beta-lactamase superfamily II)